MPERFVRARSVSPWGYTGLPDRSHLPVRVRREFRFPLVFFRGCAILYKTLYSRKKVDQKRDSAAAVMTEENDMKRWWFASLLAVFCGAVAAAAVTSADLMRPKK